MGTVSEYLTKNEFKIGYVQRLINLALEGLVSNKKVSPAEAMDRNMWELIKKEIERYRDLASAHYTARILHPLAYLSYDKAIEQISTQLSAESS